MFVGWRKQAFKKGNDDKNSLLSTLGNKPFLLRVIQSSCPDPKELESLFNWLSSLPALEDFGPEYLTNSLVGILLHFFKHKTLHWGGNPRQLKSACVSTKDVWVLAEAAHCSAAPQKKKTWAITRGPILLCEMHSGPYVDGWLTFLGNGMTFILKLILILENEVFTT